MYRSYRFRQSSGGDGGGTLLLLLLMMLPVMATVAYLGYKKYKDEGGVPTFEYKVVDGVPQLTKIEPSDCSGTEYVKKKSCHNKQTGELLDGTTGKCGEGVEEWVLDPNASGYKAVIGSGKCESDFRPCNVVCDEPCKGDSWIEGPCMRDGVVLDGSETDKCGRGMRTYTLDENAPDYKAALGRGTCLKSYASACDVECPANAVAPPACVYSSTWQRSANGCVVSKEDRAALVGYDQQGFQEYFKLALEAENCTGEKRLSEWETCTGPPGPVNCEGTWGPNGGWGPCTGSCGTQPSQSRTYSVTKEAAHSGSQCPYSNGETQTRNCGTIIPCPVDCEGYYTDPACPTACGTAKTTVKKNWITTKAQVGTGKACPPATQDKICPATAECPVDCEGYYTDPACPTACGTAASSLIKEWVTTTSPVGTGAVCPSPSTKSCPATVACPSDCQGTWELGSQYSKGVGSGRGYSYCKYRDDTYRVTRPAVGTGAACPYTDGTRRTTKITSIRKGCQSASGWPKINHTW
jgi:hypothetical protein